jgi:hypothetical protein
LIHPQYNFSLKYNIMLRITNNSILKCARMMNREMLHLKKIYIMLYYSVVSSIMTLAKKCVTPCGKNSAIQGTWQRLVTTQNISFPVL